MKEYEIWSLILGGLNLFSVIFLGVEVFLSKKHTKDTHEEQRRIQTLSVIDRFCKSIEKETRIAEKIVEKLSIEDCKKLYNYTPFDVSPSVHKNICQMCSKRGESCESCKPKSKNKYTLHGTQLTELRGHVTNYLNSLEIVAIAWEEAIVDRDILEKQFEYLATPGTKSALEHYRQVANNGKSYPSIEAFYEKIKSNSKNTSSTKKEPLGKKRKRKHH